MHSPARLSRSPRFFALLGVVPALALLTALLHSAAPPASETPAKPAAETLTPARNPERLHLLRDATKVIGWISGSKNHLNDKVQVAIGERVETITVGRDNVFSYPYKVAQPTRIEFVVAGLTSSIEVQPPSLLPPCVFFVVDRGVYRPKQKLRFAAYLRDLDVRGEFTPRPAQTVEVQLTSETKKTVAARLKLTADSQGRLIGEYTFSDADPLDSYRLSIPHYKGEARVRLAEYRKTKVRLDITGRREGSKLQLRFQGRDYLDHPVRKGRVQFVAEIVKEAARPAAATLDARQFAYAGDNQPPNLRLDDLTTEERLLAEAEEGYDPIGGLSVGIDRAVVSYVRDKLVLDEHGEAVHVIELHKDWLKAGHAVVVHGVLIDGNGREEQRSKTIALTHTDEALQLALPRSTFRTNDTIRVTAKLTKGDKLTGSGTLVAMRLSPIVPMGMMGFAGGGGIGGFAGANPSGMSGFGSMSGLSGPGGFGSMSGMMGYSPHLATNWSMIRRDLETAIVFKGDTAALRLKEPGAYLLTAVWHKPDGTRLQQEIGCTVHAARGVLPLRLQLDRDSYQSGDVVTGSIHSKYKNARVLLTLRDSAGLRLWQTIQLQDGRADVKLPLPAVVHYGCAVEITYADDPQEDKPVFVVNRFLHVVPVKRLLTVQSTIKPTLEPGEKAVLDLQVNRKEPVDLIVSVYDKALLKMAAGSSPDVRSFFLADDRIQDTQPLEVLRRRLDAVTLNDLLKRKRAWLKEHLDRRVIAVGAAMNTLERNIEAGQLRTADVATLVRLAGVKALAVDAYHTWTLDGAQRRKTFWQWLTGSFPDHWRLHFALIGDTVFVTAYHPQHNPMPWTAKVAVIYPNYFRGMMGISGMSGMMGGGMMGVTGMSGMMGMGGNGMMGGRMNMGMGGMMGMMGMNGGRSGMMMGGMMGMGGRPNLAMNYAPQFLVQAPQGRAAAQDADDGPDLSIRRDFADSAYWNAKVRTDANGKARVEFKLPDSLTGWQVVVTAISKDVHVGRHETSFRTVRPLMVTPILPRFFTEGDKVRVSANVRNRTDARQTIRVRLKAENGKVTDPAEQEIALDAGGSASVTWNFQAGDSGDAQLLFRAQCPAGTDASLKKLPVVASTVEQVFTASGFCTKAATIKLPEGIDPARVRFEVRFMPTLTADLLDTLPYLVEYPYGCVEQTMSRFLPAIKVAQILKQLRRESPDLTRKLPGVVEAGIKRLLVLQHADGGWGWYPNDATHPFMTPYALYGLIEAEKAGYSIGGDDAIPRGLKRLQQFIEQMDKSNPADRIFCLYVYGQRYPLRAAWWEFIDNQLGPDNLSDYALALALELAVQQKYPRLADALAKKLHSRAQQSNGLVHWRTAHFGRWDDDPFEITAAVLKALVAYDRDDKLIPGIVAYFMATKRDRRWNSTKDTALIIHALCDFLAGQANDAPERPSVTFRCNNGAEHKVAFTESLEGRAVIVPAEQVRPGDNRLTFTKSAPGMTYRLAVRYRVRSRKAAAVNLGIKVERRWWLLNENGKRGRELKSGDEVPRGAYVESTVEFQPTSGDGTMRFVLVENPRPAGCEVVPTDDKRFEQQGSPCLLREDRDQWVAFHHAHTNGPITDRCVLHAELPGDFAVSPAHVEMMYRTEVRGHSGTFVLRVADK